MRQIEVFNQSDFNLVNHYQAKKSCFPLISCVLDAIQGGVVYWNGKTPNFFIVHKFGFADLIENEKSEEFDASLLSFLVEKKFFAEKVRWYDVPKKWVDILADVKSSHINLVERTQLNYATSDAFIHLTNDNTISFEQITAANYDLINNKFNLDLGERFWTSKQQFLELSFGVAAYKDGVPLAICYACALSGAIAEIDVFTASEMRGRGIGKLVVAEFVRLCVEKGITPNWDCYTNNLSSMLLAKSSHFKPYNTYVHAIISKSELINQ